MTKALIDSYVKDIRNCKTMDDIAKVQMDLMKNIKNYSDVLDIVISNQKTIIGS